MVSVTNDLQNQLTRLEGMITPQSASRIMSQEMRAATTQAQLQALMENSPTKFIPFQTNDGTVVTNGLNSFLFLLVIHFLTIWFIAFDSLYESGGGLNDLTRTVFLTDLSSNDNEILQIGVGGEIRICAKPTDFPEHGYRTVGTFIEVGCLKINIPNI